VLFILLFVMLSRTTLGRAVYSVGGNAEAARLAGIPIPAVTVLVYGISGLCGALGGVIEAGRFMAATPTTGSTIALTSVAAVLLGGTSLKGGTGTLAGTLAGVLVIGVLGNGVNLLGVNSYWQGVVTGLVLVTAVALDRFRYVRPFRLRALRPGRPARTLAVPPGGGPREGAEGAEGAREENVSSS